MALHGICVLWKLLVGYWSAHYSVAKCFVAAELNACNREFALVGNESFSKHYCMPHCVCHNKAIVKAEQHFSKQFPTFLDLCWVFLGIAGRRCGLTSAM